MIRAIQVTIAIQIPTKTIKEELLKISQETQS
jgi:hypothetical protein